MTLRYVDGFDYLPAGTTHTERLLEAGGYYVRSLGTSFNPNTPANATTGRFGFGKRVAWNNAVGSQATQMNLVRPIVPGMTFTTGFVGWAVNIGRNSVVPLDFAFYDAVVDTPQFTVELGVNGVIRLYRGGGGGALLATSYAGAYRYEEDFYLEIGGTVSNTAGAVEVRVNTVPVISVISQDTQTSANAYFDALQVTARVISISSTFVASIDDHYMNDDAGAVNNTFAGNVRVKTQFAAGAGSVTTWSPTGAATNWQAALNTVLDDTAYNASNVAGNEDLYALESILGPQAVHGVQLRSGLRQTDATQRTARNRLKVSGVETDSGVDHYLNQTFTYYTDVIELNPSTGLGMTGTQLNAGQAGPKVQA